eukprot:UN28126
MAPNKSIELWRSLMELQVDHYVKTKQYHTAVVILLALNRPIDALSTYITAGCYKQAVALAVHQYPERNDPMFSRIYTSWATCSSMKGNLFQEIKCWLRVGEYEKAIGCLLKHNSYTSLKFAYQLSQNITSNQKEEQKSDENEIIIDLGDNPKTNEKYHNILLHLYIQNMIREKWKDNIEITNNVNDTCLQEINNCHSKFSNCFSSGLSNCISIFNISESVKIQDMDQFLEKLNTLQKYIDKNVYQYGCLNDDQETFTIDKFKLFCYMYE